jgi:hypothetical protein
MYNNIFIVIMFMFVGPFLLEAFYNMFVLVHQFIRWRFFKVQGGVMGIL